jgi:Family of unknown function (DUF5895)
MNNTQDFGFAGEEFAKESIPYAQFFNADAQKYGIAVTANNAELAEFELSDNWQPIEHQFRDGKSEILFFTNQPKLLILNRSKPLMSNDTETIAYDKKKHDAEGYKAFSYVVVWFLDNQNKPISKLPFRLKCSGYSGITFLKNYDYYDSSNSFCKQFLAVYRSLTSDRAIEKNELFYAHAVFQPQLVRAKVTSSVNGQSNLAVLTNGFIEPDQTNFPDLIIKNGSPTSNQIKHFIDTTFSWLQVDSVPTQSPAF